MRFFTLAALTSLAAGYAVESYDYDQDYEVSPSTFDQDFEPLADYQDKQDFEDDEDAEYERVPDYQAAWINSAAKSLTGNRDYHRHYPEPMRSNAAQANHNNAKAQARSQGLTGQAKQNHLAQAAQHHIARTLNHASDKQIQAQQLVQQSNQQIQREFHNRQDTVPPLIQVTHDQATYNAQRSIAHGPVTQENHKSVRSWAVASIRRSQDVQDAIQGDPVVKARTPGFQDDDFVDEDE